MNVMDATAHFARRSKAIRRRRLAVGAAVSSVVVLLAAALYVVVWSPLLAITAVEVDGVKILSADEVRNAAGVSLGTSLAMADVGGAVSRIAGLAPVAEVTALRDWPSTLRFTVTERKARLSIGWGHRYLIADASGVVFQEVEQAPPGLIPVAVAPGNRQLIADTGTVYSALSPAVQKKVREIQAVTRDSITIILTSGPRVIWGSVDQSDLKSQVLDALIDRKASVIDVSAPSNPTTR